MDSKVLREQFIEFFKKRDHKVILSASLLPAEVDPSVLFTTAGMQPLVPYLLGEKHPEGKRLVDVQKCIRTDDIDEVGDSYHHTFFEMLGNWSLGDYFKQESIKWSYEFLTDQNWLGLEKEKLAFSVFAGDENASFDQEAYNIWVSLGVPPQRIAKLPKANNWWGPGETGPCGPDTEMFYWIGKEEAPESFQDTYSDPRWVEIWNNVFIQYNCLPGGNYELLKQKNVDTGMGFERALAVINGLDDNYKTDLFSPIIAEIEKISGKSYEESTTEFRVIADHIKAATFAISDGALPSNKGAGYIVRRLIRRAAVKAHQIGIEHNFNAKIAEKIFEIYDGVYLFNKDRVKAELEEEETKFKKTLRSGLKQISSKGELIGQDLFDLYQSFGLPMEITLEEANRQSVDVKTGAIEEYKELFKKHQELSRTASAGFFKGGLADSGEETKKLHTAAHLLLAALRQVLGQDVYQKGSNITAERLRFDFSYAEKMTPEQIKQTEDLVNEQIKTDLPVKMEEMSLEEAKKQGAMGVFESKYGEKVKVYTIGNFSKEICGGPHVGRTGELGHFKIAKEESSSAGVRRIKAVLE